MRMMMMLYLLLCCVDSIMGQYVDFKGKVVREMEVNAASDLSKASVRTATTFSLLAPTNLSENYSKSMMDLTLGNPLTGTYIDYASYRNVCDSYLDPLRRRACRRKFNYLKEAHQKVLQLVSVPTAHAIDLGVKERIGETYVQITNTILAELEAMKWEAQQNWAYYFLVPKE